MPQGLGVHPRLVTNFSSRSRKLRSEKREEIDEDSEICFVVKGRRESGVVGFTDAVKRRGDNGSAKGVDKGRNCGLAVGCAGEEFHQRRQMQTWLRRE
jgi:hypothetical protein